MKKENSTKAMVVGVIVVACGIGLFLVGKKKGDKTLMESLAEVDYPVKVSKNNSVTINQSEWTMITTDPKREQIYIDQEDEDVDFEAIINGDFSQKPKTVPGRGKHVSFGNGTYTIHIRLVTPTQSGTATINIKRIPI